jgi:PKD repeat protein
MHVDAVNDTLWFGDFFGKRLVKLKKVTEFSGVPPTANAGPDLQVFAGDSVVFSGASSTDPDGTIESYSWSFGDGTPDGSGVTINHMYAIPGLYTAVLTVTDNDGLINSDSLQVTIKRKPGGK